MKTVMLFRHAKASRENPLLDDIDRPLLERGRVAARRMGAHMARTGLRPGLILCSPSARTRETLTLALETMGHRPECIFNQALYHAGAAQLLAALRALPEELDSVMIVGHNPGLHALALDLFDTGEADAMRRIARKFPTAALAVIEIEGAWRRLSAGGGRLVHFMTPRLLDTAQPGG